MSATPAPTRAALTVYQGPAGDHNALGVTGAALSGAGIAARWGLEPVLVGAPRPVLSGAWDLELAHAASSLTAVGERLDDLLTAGLVPVTALTRCAVALATVPVVARHRPDAVVVWFDAHADLHTPASSDTGYLGGMALSGPLGRWDSGHGAGLRSAVLVGARDVDRAEQSLLDHDVVPLVPVGAGAAEGLRRAVAGRPVYVHVDCDVLEPGLVPTDYAVPQGFSLADLRALMTVLAEHEVVGVEVGELQGEWPDGSSFDVGALVEALSPVVDRAVLG